jgi:acyl-coenzyme A synthetase/AMP-(fatty) acid ligase
MPAPPTISILLSRGAGPALALSAPGRQSLRYDGLRRQVSATIESLNRLGIGREDAVAIVLPNGPEMASAFVSIAAGATTRR